MIKTTRSRIEIRQEPDRTSSIAGSLLVAVAATEALRAVSVLTVGWVLSESRSVVLPLIRLVVSLAFAASGWFFLRGRSRFVLDLEHRMVARYMGVGSQAGGGNQSWDLEEFSEVVLLRRERRLLKTFTSRTDVVCLRRPDGSDLELYWSGEGGEEVAARIAGFTGLPYAGRAGS